MKVSVKWLRELAGADLPVERLAHVLTMGGLEVEEIAPVAGAFAKIVVAHVLGVAPHPNADKLRVAEVDAGTGERLQIVCGAPNVAAGPEGALRAGRGEAARLRDQAGQAARRGVERHALLGARAGPVRRPLGPPRAAGRRARRAGHPRVPGPRRHVLTLKLTPNRGDCLSMFGIARDLAALTGGAATLPEAAPVRRDDRRPAARCASPSPAACGHYFGRVIRGLDPTAARRRRG